MTEPDPERTISVTISYRLLATLAVMSTFLIACGDDTTTTQDDAADTTSSVTASTSVPDEASTVVDTPGPLRDYRYCEVLTIGADDDADGTIDAGVWNSMPLNDCPQEAFESIDLEATARDLGANVAVLNGPRYWVLDSIELVSGDAAEGEIHDFGGIEMRLVATVAVDPSTSGPYLETSVSRDTVFHFSAGRSIPVLTAPDGSWYAMQSYSLEVDPDLTLDGLADVGSLLDLPDGWTFAMKDLDEDLDIASDDRIATVVQDDLRNTYQLAGHD